MTGTRRRIGTDRPSWGILARLWPLWTMTVLALVWAWQARRPRPWPEWE